MLAVTGNLVFQHGKSFIVKLSPVSCEDGQYASPLKPGLSCVTGDDRKENT